MYKYLEYFQFYEMNSDIPNLRIEPQNDIDFPKELSIFSFGRNDFTPFLRAQIVHQNLLNYYLFDGASALPVLLLDIQDGHHVADFCAAPGGKSILMAMQRRPNCRFMLNDMSNSRYLRLKTVFKSFVPIEHQKNITFLNMDASQLKTYSTFDRILLDAPCTNDRHSLYTPDNNIFAGKRIQERVDVPVKQMHLLINALRCVKPCGVVVYYTCSLSPIQNDGVVHQTLLHCSDESTSFTVVNTKNALRPFRGLFSMADNFKYSTQVLPHFPSNLGPMYFSKIIKNA